MRRKLELFFRGEFYLHLATMFLAMTLLINLALLIGVYLPLWFLLPVSLIVGIAWELIWKIYDKKEISISDIIGTLCGGFLSIIILRLL